MAPSGAFAQLVALVALPVGPCACGAVDQLISAGRACTLDVVKDQHQTLEVIQAPYVIKLLPSGEPTFVSFGGSGWRDVEVVVIDPALVLDDSWRGAGDMINHGGVAFTLDRPGTWQIHLSDRRAGCERQISVQALPPDS